MDIKGNGFGRTLADSYVFRHSGQILQPWILPFTIYGSRMFPIEGIAVG